MPQTLETRKAARAMSWTINTSAQGCSQVLVGCLDLKAPTLFPVVARSRLLSQCLQPLVHELGYHLLQYGELAIRGPLEVSSHALLHVFSDLVDLDVDIVAHLFARGDHLLLGVGDQHHLPPAFWAILHFGDSQTGAIDCDITLLDDVSEDGRIARLEAECEGIAVRRDRLDRCNGINMSLYEMSAHASVRRDCPLKIDLGALF